MIVVLDFGSQYTHLITRRIRELGVEAEIFDCDISAEKLSAQNVDGVILSGGPNSVYQKGAPKIKKGIFSLGFPILGICYGHQLIALSLGGKVVLGKTREYGEEIVNIENQSVIFEGLDTKQKVWFSHGDEVEKLPVGFKALAFTKQSCVAALGNENLAIFGVQFHPEVAHTPCGRKILENFIFSVCKAKKTWKISNLKSEIISKLKNKIKTKKVMIGVSGGVDSLVAAKLLQLAIGQNLYCVFIDTGLLRHEESEEVKHLFNSLGFKNFICVSSGNRFLTKLQNIKDPEEKRKEFSKVYFQIFTETAGKLKSKEKIEFLAQGTIYPDRIEAAKASKAANLIKTHHNLSVPEKLGLEIIEPLSELYKDEVRKLGESLNISKENLMRHPFPGPGLAIRILGEVTRKRLEILREADNIFTEELKKSGYYFKVWQSLAALLPVRSVGVMGDGRTYEYIIALRAVTSDDAMTADWARLPQSLLNKISRRITNEVKGANRVLYDITQKPPATIEYE